ncbi:MAG TPA: sigma-54-dependent Fis family transcriptional regulator [Burkholderiaceae bacterium]|nr:sigma-54-dependent Fis family transcriptional regulator [Burkholderiaceae bacterium]
MHPNRFSPASPFLPGMIDHADPDGLIARSWQRSIEKYRLDPTCRDRPRVLEAAAIRACREPLEPLLRVARGAMEKLFQQVRDASYVLLLTDARGVTVDFLGDPARGRELRRAGFRSGVWWSEEQDGTCAVALSVIERQAITVHRDEHFRAMYRSLTCSSAPIFGPDGNVLAVLDASALESPDDKRSQHLVLQMVRATARMVENAYFLRQFEHEWVLRIGSQPELVEVAAEGLVAVDGKGHLLAANQSFLAESGAEFGGLQGLAAEQALGVTFADLETAAKVGSSRPLELRLGASGRRLFALVRGPRRPLRAAQEAVDADQELAAIPASRLPPELARVAGADPIMKVNADRARRVLDKGVAVLLRGESGTGKEAFARALHLSSARALGPFVAVNCAAIPESLIESELFGYREGAFTGARSKGGRGKVLHAHGGTLFLDEIGDMPLALQTRLLRVLAEREVTPLGAEAPVAVDFQLICATHCDLHERVSQGAFRLDLFYRLNGLELMLPPVRERADRRLLLHSILREQSQFLGREVPLLEEEAEAILMGHSWPGNIRQMVNVVRTALALCDGGELGACHLPPAMASTPFDNAADTCSGATAAGARTGGSSLSSGEHEALISALRRSRWNITETARLLRVCRSTVYRKMERWGIDERKLPR